MQVLAKHPKYVRETIFGDNETNTINKVGIYRVYFPGARSTVLIDDFIPVKNNGKDPAFSHSR